jgi:hypothetical protein
MCVLYCELVRAVAGINVIQTDEDYSCDGNWFTTVYVS